MATDFSGAAAEARSLAQRIGSNAADVISFAAELGEELPFIKPVLRTLQAIRQTVETVRHNRKELKVLEERCTYITACVVVRCKRNPRSEIDLAPLEACVKEVEKVVDRCGGQGAWNGAFKARSDKGELAGLNGRVDRLASDLGLAGMAILEGKVDFIKERLERVNMIQEEATASNLQRSKVRLAKVPTSTPVSKSWHVKRRRVMEAVFEAFTCDGERLVGLVGDSGAGKTTAASEIVRSTKVREVFSDGIVWLTVNEGAPGRLPSLMLRLARKVYEDIGGSMGRRPAESDDGAAYIKEWTGKGRGGTGARCLVVADNVWEKEVVSKLLDTGMWVLLSTRDEQLVTHVSGKAVGVDELSEAEAESVLRRAAELPPEVRLPEDAGYLIERCGRVAMDLAFVGRWSTVRGRRDQAAWSDAASKVRLEMSKVGGDPGKESPEEARTKRRKAILRAGFGDLAIGSDDERVQRLYLSLAVLPDGYGFSVEDAAALLYDRAPSAEDEASVEGVVGVLERWSVVRSAGESYRMHDAHSSFARERLLDRGDVRQPALERWVKRISSLDVLRSADAGVLKGLWLAIERVGGDGWAATRPYATALAAMDQSDPLLRESTEDVGRFQEAQEDWEGAYTTWHRLLEVEKRELGADHPYVLNTYTGLAACAKRLRKDREAASWLRKAREGTPQALARVRSFVESGGIEGLDAEALASSATTIVKFTPCGTAVGQDGRPSRSLEVQEAELSEEGKTSTLFNLGTYLRNVGRPREAEGLLRRCLQSQEAKLGPQDGKVASTLFQLGRCLREAGRLEEAEELLRRSLAIEKARLDRDDVRIAHTLYYLAVCVRQAGRREEAEGLLKS
eukprot:g13702.t1